MLFVSGARRREVVRALLAAASALVLTPAVTSSWSRYAAPPDDAAFDETYRGCRIRGVLTADRHAATPAAARWRITVDGRPLHLMRRADGTYLSMVDHYRSCRTALEATRAAVDEMGPAQRLRPHPTGTPGGGAERRNGHHGGDGHGVHA